MVLSPDRKRKTVEIKFKIKRNFFFFVQLLHDYYYTPK